MKISIARALGELKLLDSRILSKLTGNVFIGVKNKSGMLSSTVKEVDFVKNAKAESESILALIKRRDAIKAAIVDSNAKMKVTIGRETFTVAAAIEKKSSITYLKQLVGVYRSQLASAVRIHDLEKAKLDKSKDTLIASLGDAKDRSAESVTILTDNFDKANPMNYVDPLELDARIKELQDTIDTFESNVDIVLSESNAIETITLED